MQSSNRSGEAGSPEPNSRSTNGNGYVDPADLPADFGKTAQRAERRVDWHGRKEGEDNYNPFDKPSTVVVGGLYAAEHGKAQGRLSGDGYRAVAALTGIDVADARAVGLIDRDHKPSVAEVEAWYADHGHGVWNPNTKASITRPGLQAAIKGIDPKRKIALTEVDALAAEGVAWAKRAVAKAAADNLDTSVRDKTYSFTLAELLDKYATTDDLVGLPTMTAETRLESLRLLKTWWKAEDARAQSDGREMEAARTTAAAPEWEWFIPEQRVTDRAPHLVEGLLKGGEASSALLIAQRKAGKSSACDEIAYALTTGTPAFGQLQTTLPDGWTVVILDTEMADEDIIDTYDRCVPLMNQGRVLYADMIGSAGLLDVRTEKALAYWDDKIPEHSVIIIDCLGPLLSAAGISENSPDVAMILDALITLAKRRRSVLLVVHHLGKDEAQGARGHSSMEGKFGAVLKLTYHGDEPGENQPRFLSAFGRRGIGLGGRRKITRDAEGHLVMDGDAKTTAAAQSAEQRQLDESVFQMINLHPLLTVARLAETYDATTNKWNAETIRKSLDRLASHGRAVNMGNGGGHMWVPQWLRNPLDDPGQLHTPDTANSIAVEGSTAHETAVRACVEAICAHVQRDESQAKLTEAQTYTVLRKPGYPPRKVHTAAFTRWKAACDDAGVPITDPDQVTSLPTPEWSKGQGVYDLNVGGDGDRGK